MIMRYFNLLPEPQKQVLAIGPVTFTLSYLYTELPARLSPVQRTGSVGRSEFAFGVLKLFTD